MLRLFLVVTPVLLAACGGGSNGTIGVLFDRAKVTATVSQGVGEVLVVGATINPLPSGNVYVYIVDSGNLVTPGAASVTANGGGSFTAHLPVNPSLAPGTYEGTLTLKLCKDSACQDAYGLSPDSIAYQVTLTGQTPTTATATIKVDGAVVQTGDGTLDSNGARNYDVSLHSGQTLALQTSVSIVTWSYSTTPPPVLTLVQATPPENFKGTFALANSGDVSESTTVEELAGDGQKFIFHITVTH